MLCSEHMWSHYMENVSTLARFYTNVCLRIQNRGEIRYPHLGDCDYIKLISLSSVLVVLSRHTFAIQICGICCLPVNFLLPLWYTRVVFCILGDKWDCLFQSTRSYFEYKLYIFMKKSCNLGTHGGETRLGIWWIFHVAEEAEFSSAA